MIGSNLAVDMLRFRIYRSERDESGKDLRPNTRRRQGKKKEGQRTLALA